MAFMFLLAIAFIVFRFLSKLMEVNSGLQRQTGQAPRNIVHNTENVDLNSIIPNSNDEGTIRSVQGTATTNNRQMDYSTQISSNSSNNNNISGQDRDQQLAADEELARRLQRAELLEAHREEQAHEQAQVPFRYNAGFFNPATRSSLRDSQMSVDEDNEENYEVLPYSRSEMYETDDPEDLIRNIFPPIRTIVPQETHPVNQFLRNLLVSARTGQDLRNLPRQRIVPQQFFQLQGFDSVPPHLREMLHGDSDTSYERLLELSESLQPVSRGADPERIESLPSRQFHEKNSNKDPAQQEQQSSSSTTCNICLDDFKEKEFVTTLPQCLHSFHKTCISKWLAINKICPVCRTDITEAQPA